MYLFNQPGYLDACNPGELTVIDGGARGALFAPFDRLTCPLHVLAFDPDPEAVFLPAHPRHRITPVHEALWNVPGPATVHLARDPSTSSTYPPNRDWLRGVEERFGLGPRETEREIEVQATTIDACVAEGRCAAPDFIKLDVHAAEFEALQGAVDSLEQSVLGVLVETWHHPVHEGQHLHGEVEHVLNQRGFFNFQFEARSSWRPAWEGRGDARDARILVGSESLFLRDPAGHEPDRRMALCYLGLADLFGYTNRAMDWTARFTAPGLLEPDEAAALRSTLAVLREKRGRYGSVPFAERIKRAVKVLLGREPDEAFRG